MRVNPKTLANMMALYGDGQTATGLPEGTYVNLAAAKYVKDNDADGDKALSADEVTISKEAFDKLDADKSGKVDVKEMRAALKGQDAAIAAYYKNMKAGASGSAAQDLLGTKTDAAKEAYARLAATRFVRDSDKDHSGALSQAESGLAQTVFARLDADTSGTLSATEVQAGLKGQEQAIETYYKGGGTARSVSDLTSRLLRKI